VGKQAKMVLAPFGLSHLIRNECSEITLSYLTVIKTNTS